jgi:flagellar biosynthesis component FlhA
MRVLYYIMAALTGLQFGRGLESSWQLAALCALVGVIIALAMSMSDSFYVLLAAFCVVILFVILALTHVGTVTTTPTILAGVALLATWFCSVLTDPEPKPALPPKARAR